MLANRLKWSTKCKLQCSHPELRWVGEGRAEDTSEVRFEGEREQRFCLKVTGIGVGGSE